MRGTVDEVAEGGDGGGEADGRAVERADEEFGVRVEGVGDVEVVGYEGLEPGAADVCVMSLLVTQSSSDQIDRVHTFSCGCIPREGDVCASGEVATLARENGDDYVVHCCDLVQEGRNSVVQVLRTGIELVFAVDRDDCDLSALLERDDFGGVLVGHCVLCEWSKRTE